jgi:hypothetical protein
MSLEDPGSVSFAGIGGLGEQVRELREVIELPLMNPELFEVGPHHARQEEGLTVSRGLGSKHRREYCCTGRQEPVRLALTRLA